MIGGGSWLAHATLQSGVRVANQHSFDELVANDRLTLTAAFRRAGWQTVAVQPSSAGPWPARDFYGFDRAHDSANLGNRSRIYDGFQTPDQYTLAAFETGPFVTGSQAGQDVPVTIVTRGRAVLDRIAGWGWRNGLRPDPHAPVWPMEAFRDRSLTTFDPWPAAPAGRPRAVDH